MCNNERPPTALGYLTSVEFLLKYGKLIPLDQSQFSTLQQDNNSNNKWNSLLLNVPSLGKITKSGGIILYIGIVIKERIRHK